MESLRSGSGDPIKTLCRELCQKYFLSNEWLGWLQKHGREALYQQALRTPSCAYYLNE